ncbi:hypothetical protein ZYGR_0AD05790 [Zygosaccharomyces rouxii]|uniref:Uncharacterized protein n=1 Tax=Zygosaccharomyces rouxii TaxID=4956 RepID=A0A1Q3A6M9_ZYGRO|nr:hypothetical protein ZYGR_0AD05790 [Zygosaccharomyces rouxii]
MNNDVVLLKKATQVLLLALCINLLIKLFGRQISLRLIDWLFICSGSDCNGILWWQRIPQLERAVWFLVDQLEDHNT